MSAAIVAHDGSVRMLATYYAIYADAAGHCATCLELCSHMRGNGLDVHMYVPAATARGRRDFTTEAIPPWLQWAAYHIPKASAVPSLIQRFQYRRALRSADAAYLWAVTPESIYGDVKRARLPLFMERINCLRTTARPIMEDAYKRVGLPVDHGISDQSVAEELRKVHLADWIFSPSPMVHDSLTAVGIPSERILTTSYGWAPDRFGQTRKRSVDAPVIVLSVGFLCIRKGAHLLMDAWASSDIRGELMLCGRLFPEIAQVSATHLRRSDVRTLGHVDSIGQVYADADIFAFPTLEEGGPQVTYEAAAQGLAILTTPMGAGAIVRDGIEGIVRDPHDKEAWVHELRRLARDPDLRAKLGAAAKLRAQEFTWERVGAKRRELVLGALQKNGRG